MTPDFKKASSILLGAKDDVMGVFVEVHYNAPMGLVFPALKSAPGINDTETSILDSKLSDDKASLIFPINVEASELNSFCRHLKERIPYSYLQGIFLGENNDALADRPHLLEAAKAVMEHYYKA